MPARRVVILFNPASGAGQAARLADEVRRTLSAGGHAVTPAPTRVGPPATWLPEILRAADAECVVVVGGDGAMRLAVDSVARSGAAVWHYPAGTENLFARAFRMAALPDLLAASIAAGRTATIDLGRARSSQGGGGDDTPPSGGIDEPFAIMASTGFDAAVIHELAARRTGAISHWSYVPVILSQLRRWHAPEIWVTLDEEPERHLGRGVLVVGNLGEYGLRIDPVRVADGSDALLDGVFLPASGGMDAIAWGPKFLLTRTILNREVVGLPRFRCRTVTVRTEPGSVWQVDGDPLGAMGTAGAEPPRTPAQALPTGQALQSVQLTLEPSALRVLLPPV